MAAIGATLPRGEMSASPHLQKYFAQRMRRSTTSLLLWAVLVSGIVLLGGSALGTLTAEHTEVTATAVAETTTSQTSGGRRSRTVEQVPALRVEFEHAGERREDVVVAGDRVVGDRFPVFVDGETGEVRLAAPTVATATWVLLAVLTLVAGLWAWISFGGVLRTARLRAFDPEAATERFALAVNRITPVKLGKSEFLHVTGVVGASSATAPEHGAGQVVRLAALVDVLPPADRIPAQLDVRLVPDNGVVTMALVRGPGEDGWWAASVVPEETAQSRRA